MWTGLVDKSAMFPISFGLFFFFFYKERLCFSWSKLFSLKVLEELSPMEKQREALKFVNLCIYTAETWDVFFYDEFNHQFYDKRFLKLFLTSTLKKIRSKQNCMRWTVGDPTI